MTPDVDSSPVPVSIGQRAFLFAHELFAEAQVLNTGLAIGLRGALNVEALRRSLDALIIRLLGKWVDGSL